MYVLLSKPMTRQEFLTTCGVILLGLLGVTAFLKNLSHVLQEHSQRTARLPIFPTSQRLSFGVGPYGK
jgi:hypothetical protein